MRHKTLGAVALIWATFITGCTAKADPMPELQIPAKQTVRYEVTSSNGKARYDSASDQIYADVTMTTPTGNVQASPDIPMKMKSGDPVEYQFNDGDFVYISAQVANFYGDITCRIIVDGVTISENTSSGEYAIATCKGNA